MVARSEVNPLLIPALGMLGLSRSRVVRVPVDDQGAYAHIVTGKGRYQWLNHTLDCHGKQVSFPQVSSLKLSSNGFVSSDLVHQMG